MTEVKTKATDKDVIEYLNGVEDNQMRADCLELLDMVKSITKTEPQLWGNGTIGFGTYHYKSASGREGDWYLTGFSPRKNQISISTMAGFNQFENLMQNLGKFKTGVGCLYIKKLDDVDKGTLKQLIERSCELMKAHSK